VEDRGLRMHGMSHLDDRGRAVMVDVSGKEPTRRSAKACGHIDLGEKAAAAVADSEVPKGDVLAAARIGAIQAVKRTWELIPLCHMVSIGSVSIEFQQADRRLEVLCSVEGVDSTGFEMEALLGVSTALLIIYDMTKSLDRGMEIGGIRLLQKSGGKSGEYRWQE